jgi:Protein of Unknown function (DUF2784)
MKKSKTLYLALNGLFHVVHLSVIGFVLIGWIFPALLMPHLVLMMLTLGSWFVLGRWFGSGYCPISDWHWKIKEALGEGRPTGTYIHLVLQKLLGRELNSDFVDKAVVITTIVIFCISLALNLRAW